MVPGIKDSIIPSLVYSKEIGVNISAVVCNNQVLGGDEPCYGNGNNHRFHFGHLIHSDMLLNNLTPKYREDIRILEFGG